MNLFLRLSQSNLIPRIVVGSMVLFFIYRGVVGEQKTNPGQNVTVLTIANAARIEPMSQWDIESRIMELARTDHITLLKWALENYEKKIHDYTLVLHKQERINGVLKEEEIIDVKFRDEPFSVLMQWQKNAGQVDKLLYVEGQNDNQMLVHPTGWLSWIKSVKRNPRDKEVKRSSRRTCDQFGFYRSMEDVLEIYELARKNQDLHISCLGRTEVLGRRCVALERRLPPEEGYPYARLVMEFDLEYLLPISVSSYDWQGNLLSQYQFGELRFNTGLTAQVFTTEVNGL